MANTKEPTYLGDGVYAQFIFDQLLLTTGSHLREQADNKIYLEPDVAKALVDYLVK